MQVDFEKLNTPEREASESLITVHRLTKKAGVLYEKLRYLIDYQEEHHIRRNAIERILKRNGDLLHELVTGGYLFEQYASEIAASEIRAILEKYRALGTKDGYPFLQTVFLNLGSPQLVVSMIVA